MAAGLGAHVTILDVSMKRLRYVNDIMPPHVVTGYSNEYNIRKLVKTHDLIVGGVLIRGGKAPNLITRDMLKDMHPGTVIVDVAVDQGGCVETSRPTTHDNPTFVEEGVTHYCVPNIPSVVARTATHASFNAAFPYILEIVTHGVEKAIENNSALAKAVNTHGGKIYNLSRLASKTG